VILVAPGGPSDDFVENEKLIAVICFYMEKYASVRARKSRRVAEV
jgi:hypothetical protein